MDRGKIKFLDDRQKREQFFFIAIIVILAVVFGSIVRLNFISGSDLPVNDGGLFFQMTEDLMDNNFKLPKYTSYNTEKIPFAYPPLGFYLAGGISILLDVSLLDVYRYLPCILSICTIPAFFLFAKRVLPTIFLTAISTYIFAMIPRAFEWFVMGGGVTRSLGFLFAIFSIRNIWCLFETDSGIKNILSTVVFSSLTVMSHPETGLFVIFIAFVFFIYHKPTTKNFIHSLYVAFGVILCCLPWAIPVIKNHSLKPFAGAGGTGHGLWFEVKNILTLNYNFENIHFLTIISVFALIAILIRKRKLTLLFGVVLFVGYWIFPRSGINLLTVFLAVSAGIGLVDLLRMADNGEIKLPDQTEDYLPSKFSSRLFFSFILIYLFLGSYFYKYSLDKNFIRLTAEDMKAVTWVKNNTEANENILVYPLSLENRFWWNDYLAEWLPALTERKNVSTVQGYEWFAGEFERQVLNYVELRSCTEIGPVCVAQWENENRSNISYVLLQHTKKRPDQVNSFAVDQDYRSVHETENIIIFKKAK